MIEELWQDFGIKGSLMKEYGLVPDYIATTASTCAVLLVLLLCYRVISLFKASQNELAKEQQKAIPELLSLLRDFTQFQVNSIRDLSGALLSDKDRRTEAGLFFIGAVEYVVKKNGLSSKHRHQFIVQLLQESMAFSAKEVSRAYSQALAVCSVSSAKNTAKLGAKAFKAWSSEEPPKEMLKLSTVLS